MKLVITGGHHTGALPIIHKLKEKEPDIKIYWFGHKHSLIHDKNPTLEYQQITELGIPFVDLKAGKLYRTFNIGRLLKIPLGFFQALFLLLKIRPDIILSFGGYLAVPVVLAGWVLRIPSVTHEQTVVSGYANKLISRFAKKVLISWPQSAKYFPKEKIVHTGLAVRDSIFTMKSDAFTFANGLPTVYITAGKTGSHKINGAVLAQMEELLQTCNIIHQTGDYSEFNDFEKLLKKYNDIKAKAVGSYYARKFVDENEIGEAFNISNLVVCRAGAHIIADVLALEKPALLIPIPWVSHNEQNENAKVVVESGLGSILSEDNLAKLAQSVKEMLADIGRFKLRSSFSKDFIKPDSADLIIAELYKALAC